jgi:hemolysin activation/secretion protein
MLMIGATGRMAPEQVETAVRAALGQPIDATRLSEDLDWLNRSPFRSVNAEFSPGGAIGETDLTLDVTETKPWSAYLGYDNSGTVETDLNRVFAGIVLGDFPVIGSVLADQLTASPDFYVDNAQAFGAGLHPKYLSDSGRIVVPTAPRQDFESTFSLVETNTSASPFDTRTDTDELALGYRTALSNFSALEGDVVAGIEAKTEHQVIGFGGVPVVDDTQDIFQGYLGWDKSWNTDGGNTGSVDLTVHFSPGGIDPNNTDAALSTYSTGRVSHARYAYADIDLAQRFGLGSDWAIDSALNAQIAGQPLPDTEQLALGGNSAVRGYSPDDGSYDAATVLRNELRTPIVPIAGSKASISPFALLDLGYGYDVAAKTGQLAASIGAGADLTAGSNVTVDVAAAYALTDATVTHAGDWRLSASAKAQY